jgi:hypothetical protein
VGLLVLTGGVVISILGVVLDDQAMRFTGLISLAVGTVTTLYDAKVRRVWPWNRMRF